jgi:hypothetical protein
LKHGARVDIRRSDGKTPYLLAVREGHELCISILMAAGADPCATDNNGRSASDLISTTSHLTESRWKLSSAIHGAVALVPNDFPPLGKLRDGSDGCPSPAPSIARPSLPARSSLRRRPNCWSDLQCGSQCDSPIVLLSGQTPPSTTSSSGASDGFSGKLTAPCLSSPCESVSESPMPCEAAHATANVWPVPRRPSDEHGVPSNFSLLPSSRVQSSPITPRRRQSSTLHGAEQAYSRFAT